MSASAKHDGDRTEGAPAAEYAYEQLRNAITEGRLEPGAQLSQVALSRELGISRTPLREAVRRLQQEGLLRGRANERLRVPTVELSEFDTLCAIRIVNESLAIRLTVPQLGDEEVDRIDALRLRMEEGKDSSDEPWWDETHREFHLALLGGATGRIRATLDRAYDFAEVFRAQFAWWGPPIREGLPAGLRGHREIMDAVRARDAQQAAEAVAQHHARGALGVMHANDPLFSGVATRNALALLMRNPGL